MERNDVQTFSIKRQPDQVYVKAMEVEWLLYLGFTREEIESNQITLVIKADYGKHGNFIGIGKAEVQK